MKSKIFSFILIALSINSLSAQNKPDSVVHRNVTVEREYQPTINDAGKIISTPKVIEPTVEKTQPIYSTINTPLNFEYNIHTLAPEELKHTPNPAKNGFARIGLGYPQMTLADFMYPVIKNESNRLDFTLRHLGVFGDKMHSKSTADIQFNHLFNNFDLFAVIGAGHDLFNYYGRTFGAVEPEIMSAIADKYPNAVYTSSTGKDVILYDLSGLPLKDTHWRLNAKVGARSLPLTDELRFNFELNYNLFKEMGNKLNENHILLKGLFDVPFENNRLGMNIEVHNLSYTHDAAKTFNFGEGYSVIKLNPFYKLVGEDWFLRLGAKTGISIGQGKTFTPSPDISAQWNAIKRYLAIYGGIGGDLKINTLNSTYDESRYISPEIRLNDLYTPVDAYLGMKLSPVYNLIFDVYGNYQLIDNQYFYYNIPYTLKTPVSGMSSNLSNLYINRFDALYSSAKKLSAGMRINYDYKNIFNTYVKGAYHHWEVKDQEHAWQLPTWDVDFGAGMKIGNDISLNTQFIFQDGRYALLGSTAKKMTTVFDWNLGASYAYRDWVSAFVKVNNILNSQYETYNGYEVVGTNFMVGAAFSF